MASGHVNRIRRPDTWLHRPMLRNVKKVLANTEPSTHDPKRRTTQLIGEVRLPIPAEPGQLKRYDREYKRTGTANLFIFLDVHRPWRACRVMRVSIGERPSCPICKHRMGLARVTPGQRGFEERTFECMTCHK
jgi:hypothetical protein